MNLLNFRKKNKQTRSSKEFSAWLVSEEAYDTLCCSGYNKIGENPEVQICVNKIADLVSSMTIKLMENTDNGDKRIKDGLSRKIDINPNKYMTRKSFIFHLVKTMILYGNGNCICLPHIQYGENYLENIDFFDMRKVTYNKSYTDYSINYKGQKYYYDEVLHFVLHPSEECPFVGEGYNKILMDTVNNLKQAAATRKGFMSEKYKPNLIIKVDATTEELSNEKGRQKILDSYIKNGKAGTPWIIPAEQFQVEQVKPLTLNDLAINDSIKLDKETVARVFGVPGFLVGTGEKFDKEEHNNFIDTVIMTIAQGIQQELTKKLLLSTKRYLTFNPRSIYAYNLSDLAKIAREYRTSGLMTGNESRDWVGLEPKEGLDELVILENYIPASKIGQQTKLLMEGGDEN